MKRFRPESTATPTGVSSWPYVETSVRSTASYSRISPVAHETTTLPDASHISSSSICVSQSLSNPSHNSGAPGKVTAVASLQSPWHCENPSASASTPLHPPVPAETRAYDAPITRLKRTIAIVAAQGFAPSNLRTRAPIMNLLYTSFASPNQPWFPEGLIPAVKRHRGRGVGLLDLTHEGLLNVSRRPLDVLSPASYASSTLRISRALTCSGASSSSRRQWPIPDSNSPRDQISMEPRR